MASMINRLALVCMFLFASLTRSDLLSSQISSWQSPRAAIIRDAIYFEGGWIRTSDTFKDGDWDPRPKGYEEASIFRIRLNESFDIHADRPARLEALDARPPNNPMLSGYMFADTDEFYSWGGYVRTASRNEYRVLSLPLYDPPEGKADDPNYLGNPIPKDEPDGFAFKITHGAGVNVPSENLSFYFGGLRRGDNKLIESKDQPPLLEPSKLLVTVNTTNQGLATWTPLELPEDIRTRAEAGLVWIPAGSMGMLVAFAGTINQSSIYSSSNLRANPEYETNNTFTQEIVLFDPAIQRWYKQPVQVDAGFPPLLAGFCAVAATHGAGDSKHHDIYVIGGFEDSKSKNMNPDVWVLSIPSFKWTKLPVPDGGRPGLERYSHSCFLPYPSPNQIITVGGLSIGDVNLPEARAVDVFDMNTLQWTGAYNPTKWTAYVPSAVINDTNPAEPLESMAPGLLDALRTVYDPEGVKTANAKFWPFPDATVSSPTPTPDTDSDPLPGYVVPVAATLGSVGGISIIALLVFCCIRQRRRRQQPDSQHRQSTTTTGTAGHGWIDRWRHTAAKDVASDIITETDAAVSPQPQPAMSETTYRNSLTQPSELESAGYFRNSRPPIYEIDSSTLHEVHGRSSPGHFHEELDPRRFPMYPPSVVSGGHYSHSATGDDSSVSHPTASPAGITPSSPTASRSSPLGMAPIASIPETAAFSLNGHGTTDDDKQQDGLTREASQRAVSPLASDSGAGALPRRPGHRRHNSSMSSGLSPLPSPGMGNGYNEGDEDEDEGTGKDGGKGHTI